MEVSKTQPIHIRAWFFIASALLATGANAQNRAQEGMGDSGPTGAIRRAREAAEPITVHEAIYQAWGFGNTFMIVTGEGNVIVDTSMPQIAPHAREILRKVSDAPVRYIILTHGHGDHTGGVAVWKEEGTRIVAQRNYAEFRHYQQRLAGFFALRNAAQFAGQLPARPSANPSPGNYAADIDATILFDDRHEFELGGMKFELFHAPGETPDHLAVWIPSLKALFVGDNYYDSFPNLYTLRGTQPRWALDYVQSIDKYLALQPEIMLPSHGAAINGVEEIKRKLTQYRDAILYVHDATVRGMNDGKDVFTLMREIKLPPELDVGEGYGRIDWSVRGIYEGYAGWFDGNPATMYAAPPASALPDLVKLAGGADPVAARARERLQEGKALEALHLADAAIAAERENKAAWSARLAALEKLLEESNNSNEAGWLRSGIAAARAALGTAPTP